MIIKPKKISVTTADTIQSMATMASETVIKNIGTTDCYIDFNRAIDTNDSYVLEAGEQLTIEGRFENLHHKTASGTTTIHTISIQ